MQKKMMGLDDQGSQWAVAIFVIICWLGDDPEFVYGAQMHFFFQNIWTMLIN